MEQVENIQAARIWLIKRRWTMEQMWSTVLSRCPKTEWLSAMILQTSQQPLLPWPLSCPEPPVFLRSSPPMAFSLLILLGRRSSLWSVRNSSETIWFSAKLLRFECLCLQLKYKAPFQLLGDSRETQQTRMQGSSWLSLTSWSLAKQRQSLEFSSTSRQVFFTINLLKASPLTFYLLTECCLFSLKERPWNRRRSQVRSDQFHTRQAINPKGFASVGWQFGSVQFWGRASVHSSLEHRQGDRRCSQAIRWWNQEARRSSQSQEKFSRHHLRKLCHRED